jgi:hypothetical protein
MTELSEKTLKQYDTCIRILEAAKVDPLKHEETLKWMAENRPTISTQKNYLAAVVHWVRKMEGSEAALAAYRARMTELQEKIINAYKDQELTEREKSKYLEWPKIAEAYTKALEDATLLDSDKLLMGFYTQLPPLRLDYCNIAVYHKAAPKDASGNYVVVKKKGSFVHISEHKTAKKNGTIENVLPDAFGRRLRLYLKSNEGTTHLFQMDEKTMSKRICRLMNKYAGKPLGPSMLRHSYISHFLDSAPSLRACEELAKNMGHSVMLQQYYRRLRDPSVAEKPAASV